MCSPDCFSYNRFPGATLHQKRFVCAGFTGNAAILTNELKRSEFCFQSSLFNLLSLVDAPRNLSINYAQRFEFGSLCPSVALFERSKANAVVVTRNHSQKDEERRYLVDHFGDT